MQCVQNLITERVVVFSLSGGLTCSPLTMCDVDTSVALHYYPHPLCAPGGCIHHSSLSVYPRQQSSEHLATVTQQHTFTRLIGSSPWQVNVPYISISNKIQATILPSHLFEWGSSAALHICQSAPLAWSQPSLQSTVSQFWWNSPILGLTIQSLHCDILYNLVPYKLPVRTLYTNLGWLLHPEFSWNHHIHSTC